LQSFDFNYYLNISCRDKENQLSDSKKAAHLNNLDPAGHRPEVEKKTFSRLFRKILAFSQKIGSEPLTVLLCFCYN